MPGLFGSTVLDVAIGMIFIYLLLSLISSSVNELLASFLKLRARDLERGMRNMLCDEDLAERVLNHPLIKAMGSTRAETPAVRGGASGAVSAALQRLFAWLGRFLGRPGKFVAGRKDFSGKPSYVASRTFANALLDALDPGRPGTVLSDAVVHQARDLAAGVVPLTDEVTAHLAKALETTGGDVKATIGASLGLAGEALAPITGATTLADLRAAVERVPEAGEDVVAAKQRVLEAIAPLELAKKQIGQALGSILDVSLDPGQAIVGVEELKRLVEQLADDDTRPKVVDALAGAATLDDVKRAVLFLPASAPREAVLKAVEDAQAGLERFRLGIEAWYDDAMDRVSGVYRRRVRWWLVVIGFGVAAVVGADTISIYRALSTNPTARAAVVAQAESAPEADWCLPSTPTSGEASSETSTAVPTPTPTAPPAAADESEVSAAPAQDLNCLVDQLNRTNLGFGYSGQPALEPGAWDWWSWWLRKAIGLVLTTVAVALGAPFWFDVLGKVSSLRGAGPRPAKAEEAPRPSPGTVPKPPGS